MMNDNFMTQTNLDEWRWQTVREKNPKFDGAFLFGVATTRIYCRPSCASRLPRLENVRFFADCAEAERKGFRACLRCEPNNAGFENPNVKIVRHICELIETSDEENLSLDDLSAELNVSPSHLQRTFKQVFGVSPREFGEAKRIEKFKRAVKKSDVTTALYDAGFNSSRALYENSAAKIGMTPAQYRGKGKNIEIGFTIAASPLGKMLVAATARGICAVSFGDTEKELTDDLREEFAAAEIKPADEFLQNTVREILRHLAGEQKVFDLPLDLQATAFQMRVWAELRKIPYGETRSYKQIAEAVEKPKAVRAVARACAGNPTALLTPCHRVVASDGKLSGYAWGVERKKMLLDKEQSTNLNIS